MITEAITQLTDHQVQVDFDGAFVGVSRQALDEVLAYIAGLSDTDIAIGEDAFRAGYKRANDDIGSYAAPADIERAWSEYDPPEDLKGR